jgi:uncharacterized protein
VALFAPFPVLATFVHVPGLPKNAPVTDFFAAFVPAAAALILVYRAEGAAGVRRLLHRVVDYGRVANKLWYLPVVLLPVVSLGASYALMVATGWQFHRQAELPATTMLLFVPVFLAAAVGEELGWSGYVIEPLQHRFGALGGNLVLAVPWYGLHLPSILYSGLYGPTVIVLGLFGALGFRVLWGWLFNNTGHSVFAIIVVHAVTNMCTAYVPGVPTAANAPLLVALAVLVTLLWGPRTLSRFRLPGRRWSSSRLLAITRIRGAAAGRRCRCRARRRWRSAEPGPECRRPRRRRPPRTARTSGRGAARGTGPWG